MIIKKLVVKTGTACSLRCVKCGEFNPYLGEKRFDFNPETLSNDVFRIAKNVDRINVVHVAGGEPFLHKNLYLFLSYLSVIKNLDIIEVVTNGTIKPPEIMLELLSALEKRVVVIVSGYGGAGVNQEPVISALSEWGINHRINKDMVWKDKSDVSFKNCNANELPDIAKQCGSFRPEYFSLINGIITAHCPTSGSILYYLSLYDKAEGFYFDIRKTDDKDLQRELEKLNVLNFTPMCNWCVPTNKARNCIAGEQIL